MKPMAKASAAARGPDGGGERAERGRGQETEAGDLDHAQRRIKCLAAKRQGAHEITTDETGAERTGGREGANHRRLSGDRRGQIAAQHDARPKLSAEDEQEPDGNSARRESRRGDRVEP